MDNEELRRMVKEISGAAELYHVTTFWGYREDKEGKGQELTVKIRDGGPNGPGGRFNVHAWTSDGRDATGNGDDTIAGALSAVHWGDLDRDRTPRHSRPRVE